MDPQVSTADPTEPILSGDPLLSDENRAQLWDVFHGSKDPAELEQHLQSIAVPDDTKKRLIQAKHQATPPLDKVTGAMTRLAQLDPQVLEMAEAHPNVLKVMVNAATTPEKEAAAGAGAPSGGKKGKGAEKTPKMPAVEPDYPATPAGHVLAQTSDGAMYHIPAENVDQARQIDPGMKILHSEPADEQAEA